MKRIILLIVFVLFNVSAFAESATLDGGRMKFDFSDSSWKLSDGGEGEVLPHVDGVEGAVLQLVGKGSGSSSWIYSDFPFDQLRQASKGGLGLFRFKARTLGAGHGGMTGPRFCNKDFMFTPEWKTYTIIFPIRPDAKNDVLRLGQWEANATFQFAEAEILPVTIRTGDLNMTDNETFNPVSGTYSFTTAFDKVGGSCSPALQSWTAGFNTNRWCFGPHSEVVYKFNSPCNKSFKNVQLEANSEYYVSGKLAIQFSVDGENWQPLAELTQTGTANGSADGLDAKSVWIRFVPDNSNGNTVLQLHRFRFTANIKGGDVQVNQPDSLDVVGKTHFWELVSGDGGYPENFQYVLPQDKPGQQFCDITVNWKDESGADKTSVLRCSYYVPDFYREDYGWRLNADVSTPIWWADAMHKIPLTRKAPKASKAPESKGISLSAAGNDYESAQLVVRPDVETKISAKVTGDLKSADGKNSIPASNVELRSVYYHYVSHPTDSTGVRDFWPDALPPLPDELTANAGKNCPIWITIYVPAGTPAGTYKTNVALTLTANGQTQTANVPVTLRVWGFALPKFNTVETAFGFHSNFAWQYHGVKSEADKRVILDKYFKLLSRYRISPYNPVPLDPFNVRFVVDEENPENSHAEIDFSKFDPALANAIEKYHFTGMILHIQGMGGGTFQQRWEPQIKGFGEDTPQYKAMFKSQVVQLQNHFKEKGWLNMCYTYWFDEPAEKDYEFVRNGMNRIKRYAPEIPNMITEEPAADEAEKENLGKIDVWCPVTPNYNHELAQPLKDKGARFWTYVCCWPHAPYCTEFIDHAAVEMRTWLWQTWKYDITGVLVWQTNYWTSNSAFPDPNAPQNPYLAPMSYVTDGALPPGTKRFWGNGDGRFFYPPLSCQTPSSEPNFDDPVPSIRFESLREGIEDFEMLQILKSKLAEAKNLAPEQRQKYESLLEVPEEITSNWTTFNFSPDAIYQRRAAVAEAIEELSNN
ncbi:MAG: DUF4091 domain-containing protein [Thermoguttaceae bacterium]|nr:DUF4091 domain-containing protein [Thermoguttaceae bacterium]